MTKVPRTVHNVVAGTKTARQLSARNGKIVQPRAQAPDIEIHNKMVEIKKKEKAEHKAANRNAMLGIARIEGR